MQQNEVYILGTGKAVPEKILTNKDLEQMVDTSDEWIRTRTGMVERRIADETTAASDLSIEASRHALESANVTPEDIDLVILGTISPDHDFPSTATIVQHKLGIPPCPAFDISAACSGFLYGMGVASAMIKQNLAKNALVIGVEILTKITNWEDRSTCVLFGDGAGAVVLSNHGKHRLVDTYMKADGQYGDLLIRKAGGSRQPIDEEVLANKDDKIYMDGNKVFKHAVRSMREAAVEVLYRNGLKEADVDWLIPHQANTRIIDATAQRLGLEPEQVIVTIDKYANTSSSSIPIAFDDMVRQNKFSDGNKIVMAAFGGGFTWAASLIEW